MRVYVPFDDGSLVSFDGERFTLHRRPVGIDADRDVFLEEKAEEAWERNCGALAGALESAWRLQKELRRRERSRSVYSRAQPPSTSSTSSPADGAGIRTERYRVRKRPPA